MAFYMATGHESMGDRPSLTGVPNHFLPTYILHMLSKMKSVAKIKYLTAIPLSNHIPRLLPVGGNAREVWQAVGAQPARGRLGSVAGWPAMIHPTNSICFTPGSCHAPVLTHRDWCQGWRLRSLGLVEVHHFKTWLVPVKKQFKSGLFSWWRKSLPEVSSNHRWAELPAAFFFVDYTDSIRSSEIPA